MLHNIKKYIWDLIQNFRHEYNKKLTHSFPIVMIFLPMGKWIKYFKL